MNTLGQWSKINQNFLAFIEAQDAFWFILKSCWRTLSSGFAHVMSLNAVIKANANTEISLAL